MEAKEIQISFQRNSSHRESLLAIAHVPSFFVNAHTNWISLSFLSNLSIPDPFELQQLLFDFTAAHQPIQNYTFHISSLPLFRIPGLPGSWKVPFHKFINVSTSKFFCFYFLYKRLKMIRHKVNPEFN
jgi:hypothetical protein